MSFRFEQTSASVLGIVAFRVQESLPDLMICFYVKGWFAKMTALPDNLTETPESVA